MCLATILNRGFKARTTSEAVERLTSIPISWSNVQSPFFSCLSSAATITQLKHNMPTDHVTGSIKFTKPTFESYYARPKRVEWRSPICHQVHVPCIRLLLHMAACACEACSGQTRHGTGIVHIPASHCSCGPESTAMTLDRLGTSDLNFRIDSPFLRFHKNSKNRTCCSACCRFATSIFLETNV